jgi:hypothetical protein
MIKPLVGESPLLIEKILVGKIPMNLGQASLTEVVESSRPNSRSRAGLARIVAEMTVRDENMAPLTTLELPEMTGLSHSVATRQARALLETGVAYRGALIATGHTHALSTLIRSENFEDLTGQVPEWQVAVEERQRELAEQSGTPNIQNDQ